MFSIRFLHNLKVFSNNRICLKSINHRKPQVLRSDDRHNSLEWIFCRKVLEKNKECILFDSENHFEKLRKNVKVNDSSELQVFVQLSQRIDFNVIELFSEDRRHLLSGQFQVFLSKLIPHIYKLPNDQLLEVIKLFAHWAIRNDRLHSHLFNNLKIEFDVTCTKRFNDWTLQTLFLLFDIWHNVPGAETTRFIRLTRETVMKKYEVLSSVQALQMMYYLYWMKKVISMTEQLAIENYLRKGLEKMSLNELSIFSIGLFRAGVEIHDRYVTVNIYLRLLESDVRLIDGLCLTNILKILRQSSNSHNYAPWMVKLMAHLKWNAEYGELKTALHIALLGTTQHVHNNSVLESIFRRFTSNVDSLRLKDMERISLVLSQSDFKSSKRIEQKMCQTFFPKLQNIWDITNISHREMLIKCVCYMLMVDAYDMNVLKLVLDPKLLFNTFGHSVDNYVREVFFIDSYVKINLRNVYKGPKLNDQQCKMLATRFSKDYTNESSVKRTHYDKNFTNVLYIVESTYPNFEVAVTQPHYAKPDIYLIFNKKTKENVNLSYKFPCACDGKIVRADDLTGGNSSLKAIAIITTSPKQYQHDNTRFTGLFSCKLRQLKHQGFETIVIPYFKWYPMDVEAKKLLIEQEVSRILNTSERPNNVSKIEINSIY